MNPAVKAQVRARATSKIDLKAITPEQAIYAVLDRALLWAVLENSWWRNALPGFIYVLLPASMLSASLWALQVRGWAACIPLGAAILLLGALWLNYLITLAHEGVEARIVASMHRAVQPAVYEFPATPPGNFGEPTP
jgi:hypothetical protein